jgi:hypothetical protein
MSLLSLLWPLGKIDASVEMKVDRSGRAEHLALPLELKTGKLSPYNIGHQAQVILYTLLMSDRYGTCPPRVH